MALLRPHELMKVGGRTWSYKCRACPTPNHHRAHPFLRLAGLDPVSRSWAGEYTHLHPGRPTVGTGCPRYDEGFVSTALTTVSPGTPGAYGGVVMGERAHVETVVANGSTPAPHRGYRVSPVRRGVWPVDAGLAGSCIFRACPRPTPTGAHKRRPYMVPARAGPGIHTPTPRPPHRGYRVKSGKTVSSWSIGPHPNPLPQERGNKERCTWPVLRPAAYDIRRTVVANV